MSITTTKTRNDKALRAEDRRTRQRISMEEATDNEVEKLRKLIAEHPDQESVYIIAVMRQVLKCIKAVRDEGDARMLMLEAAMEDDET